MIDILIYGVIAVFLILRLFSVLGKRTGNDNNINNMFERLKDGVNEHANRKQDITDDVTVVDSRPLEDDDDQDDESRAIIRPLLNEEPDFDPANFVEGAGQAFSMILHAYVQADRETLQMLLADDVFESFASDLDTREENDERVEDTLVGIDDLSINNVVITDDGNIVITVKILSSQAFATYDSDDNVIDGDPEKTIKITDYWSFQRPVRSQNPNWTLISTTPEDE